MLSCRSALGLRREHIYGKMLLLCALGAATSAFPMRYALAVGGKRTEAGIGIWVVCLLKG